MIALGQSGSIQKNQRFYTTAVDRSWQTRTALLLLQTVPQYATDFVFFTDEKVFLVASPDDWQNKVSGRLQELLKKKPVVFFGAGTA